MQFLNKEIEVLVRRKKSKSLIKKQISCGIFQEYDSQNEDSEKK